MATQNKVKINGQIQYGDANTNNVFTRDLGVSVTGSLDITGSIPSKSFGADLKVPFGSYVALIATSSIAATGEYFIENAGTASIQLAGTSVGGPITNPILAPGNWIKITYGPSQGVPALYATSVSGSGLGSGSWLVYGGQEQ